jgi:tetratricopeptide (TPR) repeat protein
MIKGKNTCWLLLILFLSHPSIVMASDAPGIVITPGIQFSYAEQLYQSGDYTAAQVEFKRFIHFFPDNRKIDEAQFKVASALYKSGLFHEAAKRFNKIILNNKEEDAFTREAYFLQSKAFAAMGNTVYAKVVLENFSKLTDDQATRDRIYLELAALHIRETRKLGTDSLDQAERYLTLISPDNKEDSRAAYQLEAIDQVRAAPRKNPSLAGILAIIPGGGFLYCERYKDAFITFCLNAGLMYAAYESFNNDNPALGGVITFVEAGFYAGNIHGSVSAAHKYNKTQQIKILDREFSLGGNFDPVNKSYMLTLKHAF